MKIAVVGGGPAGATCTAFLAMAGAEVLLFDYRGAWEKPCGGGLTSKAVQRYPILQTCLEPKLRIEDLQVISPRGARFSLELEDPLLIYSRNILCGFSTCEASGSLGGTRYFKGVLPSRVR